MTFDDIQSLLASLGHLGWIPPSRRTDEQNDAHWKAVGKMPMFAIAGTQTELAVGEKLLLTDTWDHPMTVRGLGRPFIGWHQYTGSCVGEGGGNALASLAFADSILRGDQEKVILPYWPLNYARSRLAIGSRGPGDGSLGSTFADSCKKDGVLAFGDPGTAEYHVSDGYTMGATDAKAEQAEYAISDGTKVTASDLEKSRVHLVKTISPIHSSDDLWQLHLNGFSATFACSYLCPPGGARVDGDVLFGELTKYGPHQQSTHGIWNHPKFGPLFRWQNSWGLRAMGAADPTPQEKAGGFWVKKAEVDRYLKMQDTEAFGLSQYDGYPAQTPTWRVM